MIVGLGAVALAVVIGANIGLVSGYFSGYIDSFSMRLMDALLAFPSIILALAIVAVFGAGIFQLLVAISIGSIPVYARLVRAQVLSLKEQDFVLASRAIGASSVRIVWRHILPNTFAPVLVQGSLGVAFAILAEAGLSFLGVGVRPPTASWGGMLSQGLGLIHRDAWLSIYPGAAIFITVLAINLVGDALRDVLDPRLRGL
jgi:peptide/nickel transport system permease protein